MWHIAIQERQLEDLQKSAQDQAVAGRKCLRARAAKQLLREEEALEKAERNRLLRVRYVAGTCRVGGPPETHPCPTPSVPPLPLLDLTSTFPSHSCSGCPRGSVPALPRGTAPTRGLLFGGS